MRGFGGEVYIRAQLEDPPHKESPIGDMLNITVRDSGLGASEIDLARGRRSGKICEALMRRHGQHRNDLTCQPNAWRYIRSHPYQQSKVTGKSTSISDPEREFV